MARPRPESGKKRSETSPAAVAPTATPPADAACLSRAELGPFLPVQAREALKPAGLDERSEEVCGFTNHGGARPRKGSRREASSVSCPKTQSQRRCDWCQRDGFVTGCADLISIIEEYCLNQGDDQWRTLYSHFGGACAGCSPRLLARCNEALLAWGFRPLGWAAEDVRQQLLSRLIRRTVAWNADRGPLGGWLHVIIRRIVVDAAKSAYAVRTTLASDLPCEEGTPDVFLRVRDLTATPEEALWRAELRSAVFAALARLPFDERRLATLRFIEAHPLEAISKAEGIPLTTVHRRLAKALNTLRELLNREAGPLLSSRKGD